VYKLFSTASKEANYFIRQITFPRIVSHMNNMPSDPPACLVHYSRAFMVWYRYDRISGSHDYKKNNYPSNSESKMVHLEVNCALNLRD
jgi:hypothetical protein